MSCYNIQQSIQIKQLWGRLWKTFLSSGWDFCNLPAFLNNFAELLTEESTWRLECHIWGLHLHFTIKASWGFRSSSVRLGAWKTKWNHYYCRVRGGTQDQVIKKRLNAEASSCCIVQFYWCTLDWIYHSGPLTYPIIGFVSGHNVSYLIYIYLVVGLRHLMFYFGANLQLTNPRLPHRSNVKLVFHVGSEVFVTCADYYG